MKVQASLKYIFKAIDDTVYKEPVSHEADLARWSNQGILMLNSAFTTNIGKIGTHYAIWSPFMVFLFDYLSYHHPDIIYVFLGKKAAEWSGYVPEDAHKLFATHPASAAYADAESWDCNDVFNEISRLVKEKFNQTITW